MNIFLLHIIFFFCSPVSGSPPHPLHLSIINIDYSETEQNITVAFKVFTDDFENAIFLDDSVKINTSKEFSDSNRLEIAKEYFMRNFNLEIDGSKIREKRYEFVKKKNTDEAIWVFFKIVNVEKFSEITIYNTIMTTLFQDQKNLLILKAENIEKGLEFDRNNTTETVSLK
ncbi:MAG: hypothetical protein HN704_09885 [Bacteroidetes bacterium]|jgi:hypothetical protein|nr:hypothetical protein [Bacteroidota bacterium]MBT6686855.1 hypothetical protein [Bacteroidota bacterium]MBT7144184.1 hypothetical protein [Bacteroidota bacterium]MBT7491903.1 hypothetical protein [Bacteroidota bacterium]